MKLAFACGSARLCVEYRRNHFVLMIAYDIKKNNEIFIGKILFEIGSVDPKTNHYNLTNFTFL